MTVTRSLAEREIAAARRVLELEAAALERLAESLDGAFVEAVETVLAATGRTICAGIGKSGHVARKIASTLASTGTPAYFVHPAEASHGDLGMISGGDVVIALSKSGETNELSDLIHYSRRFRIPLIAITACPASTLGRAADIVLTIPDAAEACSQTQAPTTSTTLMMALGDALAVALLERRGFDAASFRNFHPGGKLGAMLQRAGDLMHGGEEMPLAPLGAGLDAGLAEISAKGWGCVGVVDNGKLVGVITDGDVRRLLTAGKRPDRVEEAMTKNPITTQADILAGAVLNKMNERKITQIFVVDAQGAPVGIVHMHDLLKAGL